MRPVAPQNDIHAGVRGAGRVVLNAADHTNMSQKYLCEQICSALEGSLALASRAANHTLATALRLFRRSLANRNVACSLPGIGPDAA